MATESNVKRTIDYTSYDFEVLRDELIQYLNETGTFKDANFLGSNIRTMTDLISYIGALFGYYINSAANETFLPTAKRYKNLNKIAQLLRYDPRGVVSSSVDVIGSLNPEYVFGKENEFIEIPAYSSFPSTLPTTNGTNFVFTNPNSVVHMLKAFGVRPVQQSDFWYKGYPLPFTAPRRFFTSGFDDTQDPTIDPVGLTLPLTLQKPLSIINRNDPDNYKGFDYENFPPRDFSDNQSVGQPFSFTVPTREFGSELLPEIAYSVIFNFDNSTSEPYMSFVENPETLGDQFDNLMCSIILEPTDSSGENYTIRVDELNTFERFYVGVMGMQNLESTTWEFDEMPNRPGSIERIKLVINPDGNSPAFSVLVGGKTFTFNQGVIQSNKFPEDFWDASVEEYNVNLVIDDEDDEEGNFGARLEVTSQDPIANQATIGKINTLFVDPDTNTNSLQRSSGKKFGDFQVSEAPPITTTEQKAGTATFRRGQTVQRIMFKDAFELITDENGDPIESNVEYQVSLTPDNNVRTWYANKSAAGFFIYVEPNTQFEGEVYWTATRVVEENVIETPVVFDESIPTAVTADGEFANYMVQLTPDTNVQVWYEDITPEGFTIKSEINFEGRVSWSIFNFFEDGDSVPNEPANGFRQRGTVILRDNSLENGLDVELNTRIPDEQYAIQLIPNKNVNVFYNDKSPEGFKVRVEPGLNEEVIVDWYVDSSRGYQFQQHGEVQFSGRTISTSTIPGLYFSNVPETFQINRLLQGDVKFSAVDVNTVVDAANNGLNLQIDPSRTSDNDVRFIVNNRLISTNAVRVFVRADTGVWEEWERAGTGFNTSIAPGNKVFLVRVNADQLTMIEFGDGENWGYNPINREMIIVGIESVGSEGNINRGVISDQVIVSRYILGNDRTDIEFEASFVSLMGLKKQQFFDGSIPETRIIDSEDTKLNSGDLTVFQNQNSFGGNNVETVDELRKNATNFFLSQGRLVSLDDYKRFAEEVFSDYIVKVDALDYTQLRDSGLIAEDQLAQYWFNYIFIVGLNRDGTNTISKSLRDFLIEQLDNASAKMIGTEHEIVAATWVPIDVLVRYKKGRFGNDEVIQTEMRQLIRDYFRTENHELGARIHASQIKGLTTIDNVDTLEVLFNKDPNNNLTTNDYSVTAFATPEVDVEKARRNKLMELVAKDPSLVKVIQPLFKSVDEQGILNYDYTQYVDLARYEFPRLGDMIIEKEP